MNTKSNKDLRKTLLSMFLFLLTGTTVFSQTTLQPVTVTTMLTPAYSLYLSDYVAEGSNKCMVTMVFNDFNEPSWDVYLKMRIEGSNVKLQTRPDYRPNTPVTLYPGVATSLSGSDLYNYFNLENLTFEGLSKSHFEQNGRLPEGFYTFYFEVYDYKTGKRISNLSQFSANIQLSDPPMVITPVKAQVIQPIDPQFISIQWQLQNADPLTTRYKLHMYEVVDTSSHPVTAIANNQVYKIYESEETEQTFINYSIAEPLLEKGKTYAFYIQAINTDGRDICKNNGFSEVCYFHYGYPEGGKIILYKPPNNGALSLRGDKFFLWGPPDKLVAGQVYNFYVRVVKINAGQTPEDAMSNTPLHEETTGGIVTKTTWSTILNNVYFKSGETFAWQVKAFSGDQEIAKSEVGIFDGPPCLEGFKAGNHYVEVTKTSKCDLDNYVISGEGIVRFSNTGTTQKVSFDDITIQRVGSEIFMTKGICKGKCVVPSYTLNPEEAVNGTATFYTDSVFLNTNDMLVTGHVEWDFPHPVNATDKPTLKSKKVSMYFNDYRLVGKVPMEATTFELLDPAGVIVEFDAGDSYFLIRNSFDYAMNLNGRIILPPNVNGTNDAPVTLPFINKTQFRYIQQSNIEASNGIKLVPNTNIDMYPISYTADFSEEESPSNLSSDPAWKGIYFNTFSVVYKKAIDYYHQMALLADITHTISLNTNPTYKSWVTAGGLQFYMEKSFGSTNNGYYNTFPSKLEEIKLDIANSSVRNSHISGSIKIPFISETQNFAYTIPINSFGIREGYLDASLDGLEFIYNPDGGEQKLEIKINRAIFSSKERIEMNINIFWPFLDIEMKGLAGFTIWGNYDIGFVKSGGATSLAQQMRSNLNGYDITVDYIGAGRQDNLYAIGTSANIVMGEDISGADCAPSVNMYSIDENSVLGSSYTVYSSTLYENPDGTYYGEAQMGDKSLPEHNENEESGWDIFEQNISGLENGTDVLSQNLNSVLASLIEEDIEEPDNDNLFVQPHADTISVLPEDVFMHLTEDQIAELDYRTLNMIRGFTQPINDKIAYLTGDFVNTIDGFKNNVNQTIEIKIDQLLNELAVSAANSFDNETMQKVIQDVCGVVRDELKQTLTSRIDTFVKQEITDPLQYGLVDVFNQALATELSELSQDIIEEGFSDFSFSFETTINNVADNVIGQFDEGSLEKKLKAKGNALIKTLDPEAILAEVIAGIKAEAGDIALALAGDIASGVIDDVLDDFEVPDVVGQLAQNVELDFSNLGEKLKNGDISGIIKFDPTYIVVRTSIADFEGYVKFTDDDPLWGDSWQAGLTAKVKVKPNFTVWAEYINGNKDIEGENCKYWFLEIGVGDLGIPLGGIPLSLDAVSGKVYHHMKRETVSNDSPYIPDPNTKYGAGLKMDFMDTPLLGAIVLFDVAAEVTILDDGFVMEMLADAQIGNLIVDGKVKKSSAFGDGYLYFNSAEKHFLGNFSVETDLEPQVCSAGQLDVDIAKGKWYVNLGTRENPIYFDAFCTGDPIFFAWFNINNSGIDVGLQTGIRAYMESPWIGFSGARFKPWARVDFTFGASIILIWDPQFGIPEAKVWVDFYAGIGVKYETLIKSGNKTIASVNLGGELGFATIPETRLFGKIYGRVQIWEFNVGFDMNVDKKLG